MLSVKGEVKPLSFDHKPSNESKQSAFRDILSYPYLLLLIPAEKTRISGAGGYIEYGRVNGIFFPLMST